MTSIIAFHVDILEITFLKQIHFYVFYTRHLWIDVKNSQAFLESFLSFSYPSHDNYSMNLEGACGNLRSGHYARRQACNFNFTRSGRPQSALGSTRVTSRNFMNLGDDDDVAPFCVAAQSANQVKGDPAPVKIRGR